MALTVIVRSGERSTPAAITLDAPRVVIGRGQSCEVLLPEPSVSHRHASIRQRGTDYVLVDEGSTNGTFVGPVRLSPQAPRILRSGDLIRVGRVWLEVRFEHAPTTQNPQQATREIALSLVASALGAEGEPAAARIRPAGAPQAEPLLLLKEADRGYVIGRDPKADLNLDDPDLSRRHLEVARRGTQITLRDLGSKNGSFLDGNRLQPRAEIPWPPSAVLSLGGQTLIHEDPVRDALDELEAAPDERMRDSDVIEPPVGAVAATAPPAAPRPAPAPAPTRRKRPPVERRGPKPGAVGAVDLVVGLAAFIVLGVSLFGLYLLFKP